MKRRLPTVAISSHMPRAEFPAGIASDVRHSSSELRDRQAMLGLMA